MTQSRALVRECKARDSWQMLGASRARPGWRMSLRTPEPHHPMLRSLPYIALAAAAIAACLLGFSWLMSVFLGRHLSLGELAAATVLLVAALAYGLSVLRVRNRRKVQDMRDSALW